MPRSTASIWILAATLLGAGTPALGGDLNPPAGPIGPTMKSLDDLAPGICLNDLPGDATAMHVITEPGVYFLSEDIVTDPDKDGLRASLDGLPPGEYYVCIYCNGRSITSGGGTGSGVHCPAAAGKSYEVYLYGEVPGASISGFAGNGVRVENAHALHVQGLRVSDCAGDGISVSSSISQHEPFVFYDIILSTNGGAGITATECSSFVAERVHVSGGGGAGFDIAAPAAAAPTYFHWRLEQCRVTSCVGPGVDMDGSGAGGGTIRVAHCALQDNTGHGIHVRGDNLQSPVPGEPVGGINVSLEQITGMTNGGDGVHVQLDETAAPRVHCVSSTLRGNVGDGLHCVGTTSATLNDVDVQDSDASHNGGAGLRVSGNLAVSHCTAGDNGGDGLEYTASSNALKKGDRVALVGFGSFRNAGSGARWTQFDGPFHCRVEDSTFDENDQHGNYIDFDDDDDCILDFDGCGASGNGLGGFVEDFAASATAKRGVKKKKARAHTNGAAGFQVTNARCEFRECSAEDNQGSGFDIVGDLCVIDRCESSGNVAHGYVHVAPGAGAAAARSAPSRRSIAAMRQVGNAITAYHADFARSIAIGNGFDGFHVEADAANLSGCSSSGNADDGYHLAPGDPVGGINVSVEQIVGMTNGGNGLLVTGGGDIHVSDGSFSTNTGHGIVLQGDGSILLAGGLCSNNSGSGASVETAGTLTVSGATMSGNAGHGLVHASSLGVPAAAVDITQCVCSNNTLSGIRVSDSGGGRVRDCSAFSNGQVGVEVLSFSHVVTNNVCGNNAFGNYDVVLPGNAAGPVEDETTAPTTDNASNYQP